MHIITYLLAVICAAFSLLGYAAFPGCPESIRNSQECAIYLEKIIETKNPQLFTRKDSRLDIRLANGGLKTYIDDKQKVGEGTIYNLIQYFPDAALAVIHAQYWEGDTHYVLNLNNGQQTHVEGYPILSPDKKRIAVYALDLVAGYGPNILAIYLIQSDNLLLEFVVKPTDWGASQVRWVDSKRVSFAKTWYDSKMNERMEMKSIRYQDNARKPERKWTIE